MEQYFFGAVPSAIKIISLEGSQKKESGPEPNN